MVSTIRYTANVSSDHHPNQVPGILIIMNPKQPNLPTCSVTSTYLLFHLLSNPSLHLIANTTLGIIMTAIKISPETLNHSILSTITNFDFLNSPNLNLTEWPGRDVFSDGLPVMGCIRAGEIIPAAQKSQIEMHPAGRNNPCGTKEPDRDASGRAK